MSACALTYNTEFFYKIGNRFKSIPMSLKRRKYPRVQPVINNGIKRRTTSQRKLILEELRKVDTHPSADEIYVMVRKKLPRVSLGTVYRNLEILLEEGEIQKVGLGGSYMRYDGNPEKHYHIRCRHCGRIDDIRINPIDTIEQEIEIISGYCVDGHELEFTGICASCRV